METVRKPFDLSKALKHPDWVRSEVSDKIVDIRVIRVSEASKLAVKFASGRQYIMELDGTWYHSDSKLNLYLEIPSIKYTVYGLFGVRKNGEEILLSWSDRSSDFEQAKKDWDKLVTGTFIKYNIVPMHSYYVLADEEDNDRRL